MADTAYAKYVVKLAKQLIEIPSYLGSPQQEEQVGKFLTEYLDQEGIEVYSQKVEEHRKNIIAILHGKGNGKSLMLNGHLDTVPPGEMKNPFSPQIQGGKLFGRGSADMKGALAAMSVALVDIAKSGVKLAGDLIFTGVVGEETGSLGMDYFLKHSDIKPDFAIVGEPTSLEIGIAHKGVTWVQIATEGKSAHGSTPEKGINAIVHMALIIQAIESSLIPKLREKRHELLGSPTINIGEIRGGTKPNIVPQRCVIRIDRRQVPGEDKASIMQEFHAVLKEVQKKEPNLRAEASFIETFNKVYHGPFEIAPDHPFVSRLAQAAEKFLGKEPQKVKLNYWTDGALLHEAGIPTIIFGPGSPAQAHTMNEFVGTEELVKAALIYREIAFDVCGDK